MLWDAVNVINDHMQLSKYWQIEGYSKVKYSNYLYPESKTNLLLATTTNAHYKALWHKIF